MKTVKIIGSVYTGPEFKARKFNIPSILAPIVTGVLGFFGYYAI